MTELSKRRLFLERCGLLAAGAAAGAIVPAWLRSGAPEVTAQQRAGGVEQRLKDLGIVLPETSAPRNTYVPAVRVGALLFVAGHGPLRPDGQPLVGKVGRDLDVEEARNAARLAGLRILSAVREALGSLDHVARVVKTLGMVNATAEFTQQPQVINGCSNLMVEVFGEEAGKGARSAVGVGSLPGGIPVEIEMVFQIAT